jgi:hypothetical protein
MFHYILGYALRKHIAESLQKRSAAIRTALDHYNAAAKALRPPRATLKWDNVVEYAFLSDFDLLRDTRRDVQHCPWATPAGRLALDTHFKILRAHEEIDRLNIELRRMATHLRDEDVYLRSQEDSLKDVAPHLAHQISVYRMRRGRFNSHHIRRIRQIAVLEGFTGIASVGVALDAVNAGVDAAAGGDVEHGDDDIEVTGELLDLQEEQEGQEEEEQLDNDLLDILCVSMDHVILTPR